MRLEEPDATWTRRELMPRVFVSYSWHDAAHAHRLANLLLTAGHAVWIDHEGLDLIRPLAPQLRNAIRQADLFVLVQSEHSESSGWVSYERTCARAFCKPMFEIPAWTLTESEIAWAERTQLVTSIPVVAADQLIGRGTLLQTSSLAGVLEANAAAAEPVHRWRSRVRLLPSSAVGTTSRAARR